jgi:AraC-like DNA-binding protein
LLIHANVEGSRYSEFGPFSMSAKYNEIVTMKQVSRKEGEDTDWHAHQRGQLFLIQQGLLVLDTPEGRQVMLTDRAGWIPAGCIHKAAYYGPVDSILFYFSPSFCKHLPKDVCAFTPTALLREMIIRLFSYKSISIWSHDKLRFLDAMKDELELITPDSLNLPIPKDNQLAKLAQAFITDPTQLKPLEMWAAQANMSKRTFTRHFREQTGLSFGKWCQMVRIMSALEWLVQGKTVTWVALHLGYSSVSAFIKVFSQYVGQTPRYYKKKKEF